MAFNQASFFLFPPFYGPSVQLDYSAKTMSGEPMRLVDSVLIDPSASIVLTSAFRESLESRGFNEMERYGGSSVLFRGEQTTRLGLEQEIVLSARLDDDEIRDVYIRFLLTEKSPVQWGEWENLVLSFGEEFGFQLMGSDDYLLPCRDFFMVLINNHNFRSLQEHYQWRLDRN
jgi:hypothetical protein